MYRWNCSPFRDPPATFCPPGSFCFPSPRSRPPILCWLAKKQPLYPPEGLSPGQLPSLFPEGCFFPPRGVFVFFTISESSPPQFAPNVPQSSFSFSGTSLRPDSALVLSFLPLLSAEKVLMEVLSTLPFLTPPPFPLIFLRSGPALFPPQGAFLCFQTHDSQLRFTVFFDLVCSPTFLQPVTFPFFSLQELFSF